MSSSIFFRFKSRKDALQISFDGTSLSVFEVKREIMNIARLGDGKDFDLDIYSSDTNEVYDDDTTQIPRSTTVIARRMPAQRPGAGRASRYVTGQMPLHAKYRLESKKGTSGANAPAVNGNVAIGQAMTEAEKLQALMNASNTQLKADLEMSASKPVMRNTYNKSTAVPDKPLPPGYVCHRCGAPGHWIQACPTNTDPAYDGKHKFKRTTGIPRSMLEIVEKPEGIGEDGKIDPSKIDKGLMFTTSGEWVRAKPDQAAWERFQDQQKASAEQAKEVAQGDQELRERGLECTIDNRPFVDPVKTPCCGKTYCRDCIENALLDNDLLCPNCGEQVLLDNLETDNETSKKLSDFEAERKAARQRKTEEPAKSPAAAGTPNNNVGTPKAVDGKSAPAVKVDDANSPTPSSSSKKRSADEELVNNRRPSNPADMKKPVSNNGTPIPQGPKAMMQQKQQQQQMFKPGGNLADFHNQMTALAGSMPGMQNGMNAFANPMMAGMPMGMPGMPPMGMMNPMLGGMPNFNMMNGMGMMNGGGNGMNGMGGWQGQQGMGSMPQPQGWMGNNGPGNGAGGADGGAYFRQPVNPHRHQGKQNRRQRSVDYKQM